MSKDSIENDLQIAVDIFRDLPYLAVNGIIVLWYLYQVVAGIRKFVQNWNNVSGSHITTKFVLKVRMYKFDKIPIVSFALIVAYLRPAPITIGSINGIYHTMEGNMNWEISKAHVTTKMKYFLQQIFTTHIKL